METQQQFSQVLTEDLTTKSGIFCRRTYTPSSTASLILVMGYGGSLRVWPAKFVQQLAQKFEVISYDNRGTGLSCIPQEPSDYSIKLMAQDASEVLDVFGVTSVNVFGYSMGGCIALQYAHDHGSTVNSLTLLSATAGGALYVKPDPALSEALANPRGETLWDMYLSTFQLMYSPEQLKTCEPALRAIYEVSKDTATSQTALRGHSFAFKNFDGTKLLPELRMPVTIIAGSDDRLMPVQNSTNIANAIPQARLVLIPGCEHGAHVQEQERVVSEIIKTSGLS